MEKKSDRTTEENKGGGKHGARGGKKVELKRDRGKGGHTWATISIKDRHHHNNTRNHTTPLPHPAYASMPQQSNFLVRLPRYNFKLKNTHTSGMSKLAANNLHRKTTAGGGGTSGRMSEVGESMSV